MKNLLILLFFGLFTLTSCSDKNAKTSNAEPMARGVVTDAVELEKKAERLEKQATAIEAKTKDLEEALRQIDF